MKVRVERVRADAEATIGRLYIDGVYKCMTLEDQPRDGPKVPGETRIPAGAYPLTLYTAGTKHAQYANSYRSKKAKDGGVWHKGMLLLNNVPNFAGVLIHKGNTDADTEGCLLVGYGESKDSRGYLSISESRRAYEDLYDALCEAYARGETVDIEIVNESRIEVNPNPAPPSRSGAAAGGAVIAGGVVAGAGAVLSGATTPSEPAPAPGPTPAVPESPAAPANTGTETPATFGWPPSPQVTTWAIIGLGLLIVVLGLYVVISRMRETAPR